MPAPKSASGQLTKADACELLDKSPRSLVDYVKACRLPVEYVSGPTGRQAQFTRADVERLKRELETPLVKQGALVLGPRLDASQGVSTRLDTSRNAVADLATIFERAREYAQPAQPWLTLDEAAEYSGLTRSWLLKEAESGQGAIEIRDMGKHARGGRWRFLRDDLAKGTAL